MVAALMFVADELDEMIGTADSRIVLDEVDMDGEYREPVTFES
jgi:hypothetical protein